jgi:hypothetical protein
MREQFVCLTDAGVKNVEEDILRASPCCQRTEYRSTSNTSSSGRNDKLIYCIIFQVVDELIRKFF